MLHEIPCSFILWECKMYPGHQKCWSVFVGLDFRRGRWLLNALLLRPEGWETVVGFPEKGDAELRVAQPAPPPPQLCIVSPF